MNLIKGAKSLALNAVKNSTAGNAYKAGKAIGKGLMGAKAAYSKSWKNWTDSPEHKAKVKKLKQAGY